MKLFTAIAASALAFVVLTNSANADDIALNVRVDNVRPEQGAVRVAMFTEQAWLGEAVDAEETPSSSASVTLALTAPASGRYGLAAYQDLNSDGRLNRNAVGIPSEPYAFSNNAPIQFGPPNFSAAALEINAATETVLTLR